MLSYKLGAGALSLEIAAWTGVLTLDGHSNTALVAYLTAHALASALLSLFLLPLVRGARARPRWAVASLMACLSFAIPVAGFVGVLLAVITLRVYRSPMLADAFDSVVLPQFDLHQRMQGSFRQAGLRSFLGNAQAPMSARMRAMVALQYVSGRVASPLLRTVLSDPSEDLRLLAYGMLDTLEKRINRSIDAELDALRQAEALADGSASRAARSESARRLSDLYWELIYQDLVQGDLRLHAIQESLRYCDRVLQEEPNTPALVLRRGRLLHLQGRLSDAEQAYQRARALGLPATRVLPYEAEICFERRDYRGTQALVQELSQWSALPRLRPVVDYWKQS
ncbi:hypothetical protein [Acidovorax lacteus]|uniref:Pellicle/biofilm biosynthesis protein PelE n=1 Tax=Acidovorax lacteus TaxID=1924988 RepID=A0ABP8L007_9BURK